jgi:transcriptional regulator of acetoin/glycerol metabolism
MSEAARALGIERANLYRKTRQLGIVRIPRAEVS